MWAFSLALSASGTSYKQPGFSETVAFSGLTNPTVVRFLPDGRVLVAEKSGLIKMFDSLTDPTPTVVADLRLRTHNFWDRGLLGLAVPPGFDPASAEAWRRYIYVLYTRDSLPGGTIPEWGANVDPPQTSDPCPSSPSGPGPTTDGCVVTGQLSRLLASGLDWADNEEMLLDGWCQQFPSHATGSLGFGIDEKLYITGGDGASFNNADWGQFGGTIPDPANPGTFYTPANPCADPPFPAGTPQTKPTAEGGALRSQSPRRTAGEPRLLNGAVLRVDPQTGLALPDNPLFSSTDAVERRIIGFGLRNPFRMIVKPGSNEVWIADVGWSTWEELNKIPDLSSARNFGWPCFEGPGTQYTGLNICPPQGQTTGPVLAYNHSASVVPGDGCTTGSSSVAGMAFYQSGSNYPPSYANALFFSDYSRKCMWVMFADGAGNPNPATTSAFASQALGPVDLAIGPDGNLYYADFDGGRIVRVKYGLNAVATGSPLSGAAPLTVNFDGSGSQPAQPGDTLTYTWDFDGDGEYDDGTGVTPSHTYTTPGGFTVRLKVTDQRGAFSISGPLTVNAGNTAPAATITSPSAVLTWKVNDTISFSGSATDPQEGALPASALSWEILIHHCPSDCHTHTYQTFDGVASGNFPAPDHEYPSFLEIRLTATDSQSLTGTNSVNVNPQTVNLTFQSAPTGLQLNVGTGPGTTPFTRTVIVGSLNAVEAPSPQGGFPNIWDFVSWSDGGAQDHNITAGVAAATYTATFTTHADLSLGVAAAPEPVGAGTPLTYTLSVANAGPSQANSVSVTDTLPPGSSFVSASGTGWSCSGTGPVTCTMPSLGIAAANPISIVVNAPAAAGPIVNNAAVSAATSDPAAGNNGVATTSNVFARADLSVGQSGAPAAVCIGQPITYTLNVTNGGPSTATSVVVTDTLPAGASLVSASGTGWSCSGTSTVSCTRASLVVGAAPAITVSIDAPGSAGTATNTVAVSSATNDPSAANNSSNASTTVNAIPAAPTAGNNGPVCAGQTLQLTAATVAGATYSWTGPNGFVSTLQNPTIPGATAAASGVYSVTVTVNACTSTAGTTTAVVRTLPTAAVSGGGVVCPGGSASIQAALTGTGPWTVVWSDGVTQNGVAASPAVRSVSPAATTTYTVTAVSDANCAGSSSGSALVTVRPRPTAVAGGSADICPGGSALLSGSGGVSCLWAPATGLSNAASCSPTASPSATTTYTLTVTDANGCVSNNAPTVTVTVNPFPNPPVASNNGPVCAAGTLQLTASAVPGATYSWTGPNGFTSGLQNPSIPNVTPAASGTYSVTVTVNGCASSAATTTALVRPAPTATVTGGGSICQGGSAQITATLTGTGPWNLIWSDGVAQSTGSATTTRTVSPSLTTTYTVTTVSDVHCSGVGTGQAEVVVGESVPAPVIAAPVWVEVGATGQPASVEDHPGSTYEWTLTGGTLTSGQGTSAVTFSAGAPGTTMLLSVVETNAACTSPAATFLVQVDFLDVPVGHLFHDIVNTIARHGVTAGCGNGNYCSDVSNTREQMAVFLLKSKLGADHVPPAATGSVFLDVPISSPFAPWIEELAGLGVTGGCGGGNYCPGDPVTRAQMAVFLLKTFEGAAYAPPPATGTIFVDVPASAFAADWIEEIYNRGVTGGCLASPLTYCPTNPVTRGQMAAFLVKTFGL